MPYVIRIETTVQCKDKCRNPMSDATGGQPISDAAVPQYRYCDGTQVHRRSAGANDNDNDNEATTTVAETAGAGPQQERFVSPQTLSGETVIA